jgi:hypothetical protein
MVIGGVESLASGGATYQTPSMQVVYRNENPAAFWRE